VRLLFGYEKPIEALKRLNDDFCLGLDLGGGSALCSPTDRPPDRINEIKRKSVIRELTGEAGRVLSEYERGLARIKRENAPRSPDENPLDLWTYAMQTQVYAEYVSDSYDDLSEDEKIEFIKKEWENLIHYEKFNRNFERLRRGRRRART
jgi:hypothetical protein